MVSLNSVAGLVTAWLAVGLYKSEVRSDDVGSVTERLDDPFGWGNRRLHPKPDQELNSWNQANTLKRCYGCKRTADWEATEDMDNTVKGSSDSSTAFKTSHRKGDTNIEEESVFLSGFRDLQSIFRKCQRRISLFYKEKVLNYKTQIKHTLLKMREKAHSLYNCMKVQCFRQLDALLSDDVIPVTGYLEFVKDHGNETESKGAGDPRMYASDILSHNWGDLALERIEKLAKEYSLKIHIGGDEGRGRRRDHRMFAMMMMGFIIMASILVPMGFQFLTVLGGKSLLMAKMALIMSAINGLKKIATSNVGYGLYHAPETFHHDPHHHGFHEKVFHIKTQEPPQQPFDVVI